MYQKLIIVGYLGRDPEMRYTPTGQAVTNFSMATSNKYTGNDGQLIDETTWFRISVWGKRAETVSQYLRKGSRVLVEGRLRPDPKTGNPRIYERQDGTYGSSFEVSAYSVQFLSSRAEDEAYQETAEPVPEGEDEDKIPF